MRSLAALAAALAAAGCGPPGPPTGTLAGRVTLAGRPLAGMEVSLTLPGQGVGAFAVLDADGGFAIDEPLPVGEYAVTVNVPAPHPPSHGGKPPPPPVKVDLAAKSRREATTDLRAVVRPGTNRAEIEVRPGR